MLLPVKFISTKQQKTQTNLMFSCKNDDFEKLESLQVEQAKGAHGYLFFSPDLIKKEVEAAIKNKKLGINYEGKSPSERLRGTLYEVWNGNDDEIPWEDYYQQKMGQIIEHFKKQRA